MSSAIASKTDVCNVISNEVDIAPMLMLAHVVFLPLFRLRTVMVVPIGTRFVAHAVFALSGNRRYVAVPRTMRPALSAGYAT